MRGYPRSPMLLAPLVLLMIWAIPQPVEGQVLSVEGEGRYWLPDLDAEVKVTEVSLIGTEIDLKDDLGMKDENFFDGEVAVRFLKRHRIRFAFISMDFDGDRTITRDINFSGQTFTASTTVQSSLDVDMYRLGYEFDILKGMLGFLGPFVEARFFDVEARLSAPATGLDERAEAQVPLPAIGLVGRLDLPIPPPLPRLSLSGEIGGLSLGEMGSFIDANVAFRLSLVRVPFFTFEVAGGYWIITFEVESDDDRGELTLNGPFIMVVGRF